MESNMTRSSIHGQAVAVPAQAGVSRGKQRSACNRCHQQKLRCIKTMEQTTCERCTKLKLECRYSPRERRIVRNRPFRRPFAAGPGAWPEPRDLAPALAPAMPDMQQRITAVPGRFECGWLAFQDTALDNAEGLGSLDPDTGSPVQIVLARALATGPNRFGQLTQPLSRPALDHSDGAALHGDISFDHHNIPDGMRDDPPFELLDFYEMSGYYNGLSRELGYPLTYTAGRLTSLNMALCECASKLPSINASRVESVGTVNISHATNNSARGAALLALDEVFRVTNEFINIMKNLSLTSDYREIIPIPTACASTTGTSPHLTHGMNTELLSHVAPHVLTTCREVLSEPSLQPALIEGSREPEISSPSPQPFLHLDEATMLLFLSCHCRLTDIYESIIQAIQRCIKGPHTAPHPRAGIILPQLQVGGYGGVSSPALRVDFSGPPLPPATVSMYLVLTTTLSSQLWAQIRDAMRRKGDRDGSRIHAPMAHLEMADPAWDIAVKRTDNLSRAIEVIQNSL
ncbi:hypothetical protein F4823DRAFT_115300 [Ustulina deusta]|nr:hypothetical protein F4823DRAFT_115300 [Ustulina deusta]